MEKTDITTELIYLCETLLINIKQQLVYYRASVYKEETANAVDRDVAKLRRVLEFLGDDAVLKPLTDYHDAQVCDSELATGECSFTRKVTALIADTKTQLRKHTPHRISANYIKQHREHLLALCQRGSRQWTFFQSI